MQLVCVYVWGLWGGSHIAFTTALWVLNVFLGRGARISSIMRDYHNDLQSLAGLAGENE